MWNCRKVFVLAVWLTAVAPAQEKPALESDPQGWVDLMPDESFAGWTRLPIPPSAALQPTLQWKVDKPGGILICEGNGGHEMLRYDKPLANFILHVEWRFTRIAGDKPRYNSGILIRNSPLGEIWHQAQTGDGFGYLFGDTLVEGALQRISTSKEVKSRTVKPAGEWNSYEIHCRGDRIALWVNGAWNSELTKVPLRKGHIALEAEGYRIEFRSLKLKELP